MAVPRILRVSELSNVKPTGACACAWHPLRTACFVWGIRIIVMKWSKRGQSPAVKCRQQQRSGAAAAGLWTASRAGKCIVHKFSKLHITHFAGAACTCVAKPILTFRLVGCSGVFLCCCLPLCPLLPVMFRCAASGPSRVHHQLSTESAGAAAPHPYEHEPCEQKGYH